MAKQHLNTELLEQKKQQLENHKNNINDYLIQIREEYMKLISNDLWLGHRSDVFFESLKAYWDTGVDPSFIGPVALDQMGIVGQINSDFATMINFISAAIDKSLGKDTEAANEIESTIGETPNIEGGASVAGANAVVGNNETPAPTTPAPQTTQPETNADVRYASDKNSNYVIDTSTPVRTGKKYSISEEDKKYLAYVAFKEQGSVEGAKVELSLIANRYEQEGGKYDNVRDYVENSGWFSDYSTTGYKEPDAAYVEAVNDVLIDGNRYVPENVVQHYYLPSATKVVVNGVELDRNIDANGYAHYDKSQFIPGQTEIYENSSTHWTFIGFAPNSGDPFGYYS